MESDDRIRLAQRRRILRVHRTRTRPLLVTWTIDGAMLTTLYVLGYAGAAAYWATLEILWDQRWVLMFSPLGHTIPALIAGVYTGILFSRGRLFFLAGPLVLVAATFIREVWLPLGAQTALTLPVWRFWAACAAGLTSGGMAMGLGALAGTKQAS